VLADDRSSFVYCGSLFTLDSGHYLGLARRHTEGLDREVGLTGPAAIVVTRNKLARSPDATLALTYLGGSRTVALLALPSLSRRDAIALPESLVNPDIGFLADGTPLVLAEQRCREMPMVRASCPEPGGCVEAALRCDRIVARLEGGSFVPIANAPSELTGLVVARGGTRAVIIRADGTRALVDLPSWREIVALPPLEPSPVGYWPLWRFEDGTNYPDAHVHYYDRAQVTAVSDDGRRVAFVTDPTNDLVIAEVTERGLVELDRRPARNAKTLVFSPDGRSLLVTIRGHTVVVLREGARHPPRPNLDYEPDPPRGFRSVLATNARGYGMWRSVPGVPLDQFQFSESDLPDFKLVLVSSLDAAELGPPSLPLETWAARAVERIEHQDVAQTVSWRTARGRVVEYVRFIRGCLDIDLYSRIEERDGVVYRVELRVPATTSREEVARYLEAFVDQPLGKPARPRPLPTVPPSSNQPC